MIEIYDDELKTEISLAQKNELSHRLHCGLQLIIFCVKTHFATGSCNGVDENLRVSLRKVVDKCVEMLDCAYLQIDTKNNCAMLIVMYTILISENQFSSSRSSYNKEEETDYSYMDWIKDNQCCQMKKLAISFAIVNTLNSSNLDYEKLVGVNNELQNISTQPSCTDPSIMLSVSRLFMQMIKKLEVLNDLSQAYSHHKRELDVITSSALSVSFLNMEHHMESVRHLSKDTIKSVVNIGMKLENKNLIDQVFQEIQQLPSVCKKSKVVCAILPSLKASKILEKLENFHIALIDSLSDNKATNHGLMDCYETLAIQSINEVYNILEFIDPIKNALMTNERDAERKEVLEGLFMRLVWKEKRVLNEVLSQRSSYDIGLILRCISVGRKMGQYDKIVSTTEMYKEQISFETIKTAMIASNEFTRISAFALIIETRKTTESFVEEELECIKFFMKYNINVQNPSMRQSILGIIKNLFIRIHAVVQYLKRKKEMLEVERYFKFLLQLQEFCLENLFEGANFTRRSLCLRILFNLLEIVNEHFRIKSLEMWTQQKIDVMMSAFDDNYEMNKEILIEISKFVPNEVLHKHCSISLDQLKAMATSIKSPESLTASYLMEFKVKFLFHLREFDEPQVPEISPESYSMITWCEKNILNGLATAEKSLRVASSSNPMYGLTLGIRHLISKLDLKLLIASKPWQELFGRLLVLCKRLTSVVAPVVNNSSPEGIFLDEEILEYDLVESAAQPSPQILLLCCWRTIKEVSLFLGDISLRAPILNDGIGLISVMQMLSTTDLFLELLSKTKHRGAFEQCFFGFSQICQRLWKCQEPELYKLPSKILHVLIESISGKYKNNNNEFLTMENLCATRRSAGLPFMILALISSEQKMSANENFHYVMRSLIEICIHSESLESRTHSLNILRALFRCSELNEAVTEYVADGMKCAVLRHGADSWVERNSSTLLFTALMVRIFGVQRSKDGDDLPIRNKMTGRAFFLRYPGLYDFFMEQLSEAAKCVQAMTMNPMLHPLLLVLIRLYPSGSDEEYLPLTNFVPVVSLCSSCVELQTRVLCAKFIASVLSPEELISRISETTGILKKSGKLPANITHGILLQILYQVKKSEVISEQNTENLMEALEGVCSAGKQFQNQPICFATFINIVIECCIKVWKFEASCSPRLKIIIENCLNFGQSALFGLPDMLKKTVFLNIVLLHLDSSECLMDFESMAANPYTFRTFLNFGLLLVDVDLQESYEIDPGERLFIEALPIETQVDLRNSFEQNTDLKSILQRVLAENADLQLTLQALDLLSCIDYNIGECDAPTIQKLIQTALAMPEHSKKSHLKYAYHAFKAEYLHERFHSSFDFEFLDEIAKDASSSIR